MSDDSDQSAPNKDAATPGQSVELPVIDLLEHIGRGDSIEVAAKAANVSVDDARASFRQAARTIRSLAAPRAAAQTTDPAERKTATWQDLTVAEALGILADHAEGQKNKSEDV